MTRHSELSKMITKVETNEQYHKSSAISASGLKQIFLSSVWHYRRKEYKESDAMRLGSAIHTVLLEPENFERQYITQPKFDGRTAEGKAQKAEFEKNAKNKIILKNEQSEIIHNIQKRFLSDDPIVENCKKYLKGKIELSHYLHYQGVPVRVRPDCIGEDFISDIKTFSNSQKSVTVKSFHNEVFFRAYHLQAVFYCDMIGMDPQDFKFIVIETKPPFTIFPYTMTSEQIDKGRNAYQESFEKWNQFLMTGREDFFDDYLLFDGTFSI